MKILFVSLGCDKNLVDSEKMLGMLQEKGYTFTDDEAEADVVVVNTCCFIGDAKEESINTLLQMGELKDSGQIKALIAAGCLAQRYREEIQKEIPQVDAIIGTTAIDEIVAALEEILAGQKQNHYEDINAAPVTETNRVVTTGGHFAYLKIAEGCDKHCTYCIIPKLRGPYRSVPMEELIAEAKTMAEQGVKELVLVAQETTIYGIDLYGKPSLHLLLKELCKIQELYWIRILYCYPEDIYPELVQTMKEEPKVCHYLDLPIQHANDEILRRMGRRTSKQELIDKIDFLRSEMPDITLRTTLITGFPGETKEQHKELLEFINDMEFDRLGVFTYSPEEGTPAAAMEHQIDEEVKLDRQAELMELQQDISAELGERRIGQELLVMIEGKVADEDAYVGRSQADAPGVDGYVFVNTPETLVSGDFVRVKITGALEYDLIGEISQ
ncbi:30S ribosomal protein S12 methylthiotransferase RimO [Waltera sp.]|uniref:30S ribosomal protein S12 methylthiotransferase RimO n=1 Tax=Waltera sp. TaxID=2815806 RepID=UPI003AB1D159